MSAPRPGRAVRGSASGRPILAALDLLGRRWALRIVWELRDSALTFRELRARCDDVSPSVLSPRLAELRESGLVELDEGYALTPLGKELLEALAPLTLWAKKWDRHLAPRRA
ncbi:MAG: winged helix-turn-helix transcriptional regulator [Polyangiales bacterium]